MSAASASRGSALAIATGLYCRPDDAHAIAGAVATMLDLAHAIRSLSDFKRNTADLLDRLRKTGLPTP